MPMTLHTRPPSGLPGARRRSGRFAEASGGFNNERNLAEPNGPVPRWSFQRQGGDVAGRRR